MNKKGEESKGSYLNIGLTIVLGAILWWVFASGGAIALTLSSLPTVFWIFIILIILYLLIGRK